MSMSTLRHAVAVTLLLGVAPGVNAAAPSESPERWSLYDAVRLALAERPEIAAARARAQAAAERPTIVSALEDPMIMPSIDHYPFDEMEEPATMERSPQDGAPATPDDDPRRRYDWSIGIEQRFPLSRVRSHRRSAAEAEATKAFAEAERMALDVELEAATAYFMLLEQRRRTSIIEEQLALAHQLVRAAMARYGAGAGTQSEVLRTEVEIARLRAASMVLQAQIRSAEAMLNTSLGRAADAAVPELSPPSPDIPLPDRASVAEAALSQRPELRIASAETERADAEVDVMRSMYAPMGTVRVGYASTMAEGKGAMVMVGVSLPIWRQKLRSGVAEARAMRRMATADLDAMTRMVEGDALASRDRLEAAHLRFHRLRDDVLPRAARVIRPALAAYTSGQGNLTGVIDAAQALWSVQEEAIMAESELGAAWAQLHRTTGRHQERAP